MRSIAFLPDVGCVLAVLMLALTAPAAAIAADAADPVLVRRGDIVITKSDYQTELHPTPEQDRASFAASTRRNRELIDRMLVTRELAAQAREKKLDQDPLVKRRLAFEEDKLLAAVLLAQIEETAARDFAAQSAKFERVAREQYVVAKARYTTPETLMLTQVFFSADKDGLEGAKKRADEAYAKIRAGADIGELPQTVSHDTPT